jgi:hypothetical protein
MKTFIKNCLIYGGIFAFCVACWALILYSVKSFFVAGL